MVELFVFKNYTGASLLLSITSFKKMSASRCDSSWLLLNLHNFDDLKLTDF